MTLEDTLHRAVRARCSEAAGRWFTEALETAAHGSDQQLLARYTAAARQVGTAQLDVTGAASGFDVAAFAHWTLADAVRTSLLLARATTADPGALQVLAIQCFEQGDTGEQISWLRGVAFLPQPERFLPLVIDACRTNIVPLFEAAACENAFPARYFPERPLNQLVMKAVFNNVRLARIAGLGPRLNIELARMAADFADERRAAGRPVPPDIDLALSGARHEGTPV
jgi:hypothetical protein